MREKYAVTLGELEWTTGLLRGVWLTLPSDHQVQGSLPSLYPIFVHGGKLFWFLVMPQVSTK